jgi:hypothetical protein
MRHPFAYLVDVFQTNPRWLWRVLAAGGCGLFIAVATVILHYDEIQLDEAIGILVGLPSFFLVAACLLATMDNVERKMRSGRHVGRVPRILFGMRIWSLLLWIGATLVVAFPLGIFIGGLTWKLR